MDRRSFSVIEVMIAVLVIAVLSAAGVVIWNSVIEKVRMEVCEQNQEILIESLKFYITDTESVPSSLSFLIPKYTDIAIACLNKERAVSFGAARKIYLAILKINNTNEAIAASKFSEYLGINQGVLRCPSKSSSEQTLLSYGFNDALLLANRGSKTAIEAYNELAENELPIICDCDSPTFSAPGGDISTPIFRHKKGFIITKPTMVAASAHCTHILTPANNWTNPWEIIRKSEVTGELHKKTT